MFVGVARLALHIPGAVSLKDRRQVVRSFKERARGRLQVNVAEVGDVERPQSAVLGVAVVSAEAAVCYEVLSKVRAMASTLSEALLSDWRSRVLSFGEGGKALLDETPFAFDIDDDQDEALP